MDYEPPFLETYKTLLQKHLVDSKNDSCSMVETCELPLIDLGRLNLQHPEREECIKEISEAAREWGFFQVVNHGISKELLESMQFEQTKVFYKPFVNKSTQFDFSLSDKTYRWGNPSATNLRQLSWLESFHFSLTDVSKMDQHKSLRSMIEAIATRMAHLAESLGEILACKLNMKASYCRENCLTKSSFIRLNRYPPCPISSKVYGLMPHSDTSLLTIVYQDQVGGLQLMKDGKWVDVKPNPRALVVNIGDLFQAQSNDIYKSIKHRVVAAEKVERFSIAFFYCPSEEAVIQSNITPPMYRKFTLKEYRQQNEKDVKQTGDKVGLSRFLL
ncbi:gibberellin 2-beta-dioxygenase 8-like [Gastrolobium bilobum]|uniref:gibberellin 2-beta-dioxygenase 8-like n=1 Tax=Gastrolobium bilobum TaxID=150636 RepID=UPI002AAF28F9|nr:gibberellin 2-beta-dioxygenase 8-like [Gastrolobium bilobum]XP_061341813.1 gibberellin 2-beta-dioxygenase 8-like [Gastrolobium bilobum]